MQESGGHKLTTEECKILFANLFNNVSDPFCIIRLDKTLIYSNNALQQFFNEQINFKNKTLISTLFPGIDENLNPGNDKSEKSFIASADKRCTKNSEDIQIKWKAVKSDLIVSEEEMIILMGKTLNKKKTALLHYTDLVLNALPVTYYSCEVSEETKTIWINEKIKQMTGYEPELFISSGTFWQDRIHPDDFERIINQYKSILQTQNIELIYRWKCSDGEYRWFLDRAVCLTDETGKPIEIFGIWIDISDKKYAEDALEQTRFFIQKIVDTTPGILFVYDMEKQKTLFHNYHEEKFLQYPLKKFESLNLQSIYDYIHPDDVNELKNLFETVDSNPEGIHHSSEFRMLSMDGNYTWFELTLSSFIKDEKTAKTRQVIGLIQDVAERVRIREALRESEFSYKNLFETINEAIYIHDDSGKFIDINPGAEKMYGYTKQEFIGKTPEFLSAPNLNNELNLKKILGEAFNGIPQQFEFWGKRKNGEIFPKDVKLYKGNYFGKVVVIAYAQDITDRKKSEKKIKDQEEKLRRITDNMLDIIIETDSEGNILYVSPSFEESLGFTADQILRKNISTLVYSEDYEYALNEFKDLFNEQKKIEISFRYLKADGSYIWLEVRGKSMPDENGNIIGLIFTARDISERKVSEEKIKSTLAEKNVLLREVHHRVKNNLQAMIYLIEIQNERIEDTKVKLFLEELQEQARTISLVYEQLYQSDYLASVNMESYLGSLASNVIQAFGSGNKVDFNVSVDNVTLDVETAMPCGLITNELITNSLKYAFPPEFKGKPKLNICLGKNGDGYNLEISDNGIGMPKDLDWEKSESLGLKLVNLWVNYQLLGKMKLELSEGTKYMISFGKNEK